MQRAPGVPLLPQDELEVRNETHLVIVEQTNSFKWLVSTQLDPSTHPLAEPHPVNQPESRIVQLSSDGVLNICVSSYKLLMMNDYSSYNGTYKSWISKLASFSIFNPVKAFRMVRIEL